MFVAFDAQRDWANYDFVIIGAGVAGLFLAEKFAPAGRVLVIEAGGKDPGGLGEGYYDIDSTGRPYGALGKRLSSFGGTSNHWGGHLSSAREEFLAQYIAPWVTGQAAGTQSV